MFRTFYYDSLLCVFTFGSCRGHIRDYKHIFEPFLFQLQALKERNPSASQLKPNCQYSIKIVIYFFNIVQTVVNKNTYFLFPNVQQIYKSGLIKFNTVGKAFENEKKLNMSVC